MGSDQAPIVDPRQGDVGDDAARTKQRSLLAIAGSLLAEISLPKLLFAWTVLLLLPAVMLGVAPLVASAWLATLSGHILQWTEIGSALVLVVVVALGWIGGRPVVRVSGGKFSSLNTPAVLTAFNFCRGGFRPLEGRDFCLHSYRAVRARLRAVSSGGAGIILCGCALSIAILVWPASRWKGNVADLAALHRLIVPTLANAVVLVSSYLAIASLIWGIADASMDQPFDLAA